MGLIIIKLVEIENKSTNVTGMDVLYAVILQDLTFPLKSRANIKRFYIYYICYRYLSTGHFHILPFTFVGASNNNVFLSQNLFTLHKEEKCGALFIDLSKAFDSFLIYRCAIFPCLSLILTLQILQMIQFYIYVIWIWAGGNIGCFWDR